LFLSFKSHHPNICKKTRLKVATLKRETTVQHIQHIQYIQYDTNNKIYNYTYNTCTTYNNTYNTTFNTTYAHTTHTTPHNNTYNISQKYFFHSDSRALPPNPPLTRRNASNLDISRTKNNDNIRTHRIDICHY